MPDFSTRSAQPEMMDDFSLGEEVIYPIMDELELVNRLLGGYKVFFSAFEKLRLGSGIVVSDWGCGGGDSLRALARWSRKRKLKLTFIGVDATQSAVDYARERSGSYPDISYLHSDVMTPELKPGQFDVVISSLFSHHFDRQSWINLIKKMISCSRQAVVLNDLHRHWFAYHSIGVLTSLFSRSEMVKHDSKLSVLKGFTRNELVSMLSEAGVDDFELKWMWAFRWQLIIRKKIEHG